MACTCQADVDAIIMPQPLKALAPVGTHRHPRLRHCCLTAVLQAVEALCCLPGQLPPAIALRKRKSLPGRLAQLCCSL